MKRIVIAKTNVIFQVVLASFCLLGFTGCERFSVQKQLEKYAEQQRNEKKIPRKISDNQTLIDIRTGDLELIQVYTLRGPIERLKKETDQIESNVMTQLKKSKGQIQNLIDYKIVMTFKYLHHPSKEVVHEFQVKPWTDLSAE